MGLQIKQSAAILLGRNLHLPLVHGLGTGKRSVDYELRCSWMRAYMNSAAHPRVWICQIPKSASDKLTPWLRKGISIQAHSSFEA
jgi:hypothetical protein